MQIIPRIGIAIYPENGEHGNPLIHYADDAMYQEKSSKLQAKKEARPNGSLTHCDFASH